MQVKSKHLCILVLLTFGLTLASGGAVVSSPGEDTEVPAPKQMVGTDELMKLFFEPYHEDLKEAVQQKPRKRSDWRAIYSAVYRLAEATNLLFFREGEAYMKTPEWRQSIAVSQAAIERIGGATRKLDYEGIKEAYGDMVQTCNDCHRQFIEKDPPLVDP